MFFGEPVPLFLVVGVVYSAHLQKSGALASAAAFRQKTVPCFAQFPGPKRSKTRFRALSEKLKSLAPFFAKTGASFRKFLVPETCRGACRGTWRGGVLAASGAASARARNVSSICYEFGSNCSEFEPNGGRFRGRFWAGSQQLGAPGLGRMKWETQKNVEVDCFAAEQSHLCVRCLMLVEPSRTWGLGRTCHCVTEALHYFQLLLVFGELLASDKILATFIKVS